MTASAPAVDKRQPYTSPAGWKTAASSVAWNDPFSFPVQCSHVIGGWDEGVIGMRIGSRRKLYRAARTWPG